MPQDRQPGSRSATPSRITATTLVSGRTLPPTRKSTIRPSSISASTPPLRPISPPDAGQTSPPTAPSLASRGLRLVEQLRYTGSRGRVAQSCLGRDADHRGELLDHRIGECLAVRLASPTGQEERHDVHVHRGMQREPGHQRGLARPGTSLPPTVGLVTATELLQLRQLTTPTTQRIMCDLSQQRPVCRIASRTITNGGRRRRAPLRRPGPGAPLRGAPELLPGHAGVALPTN